MCRVDIVQAGETYMVLSLANAVAIFNKWKDDSAEILVVSESPFQQSRRGVLEQFPTGRPACLYLSFGSQRVSLLTNFLPCDTAARMRSVDAEDFVT
jgi:hypothetical protein